MFHASKHSATEKLNINVNAQIKQILAAIYNNIRSKQNKLIQPKIRQTCKKIKS
jgi:hypothetical protein